MYPVFYSDNNQAADDSQGWEGESRGDDSHPPVPPVHGHTGRV